MDANASPWEVLHVGQGSKPLSVGVGKTFQQKVQNLEAG